MRVTVTGATGRIGTRLVARLLERGDDVLATSRDAARAEATLATSAVAWRPKDEPLPAVAAAGRDAIVHLVGEDVGRRWTAAAKREIHDSRALSARNLVAGLSAVADRPRTLVSFGGYTFYGPRGAEPVDEREPPGSTFLARANVVWEAEADRADALGVRVVNVRTGVVLDARSGALTQLAPAFRLGLGGPIAGGRHYLPWVHIDDLVGIVLAALDDERWRGPVNGTAPHPVTNRDFAHALGRTLHRPALVPVPRLALQAAYGGASTLLADGVRAVPSRALELGYAFAYPQLEDALRAELGA